MPLREHEIKELESLWAEDWVLMLCTDGAELYGAVTRTEIGLRLGPELIGPIPFSGLEELLDGDAMCQRIEDDAVAIFEDAVLTAEGIDLEAAGLARPASTWTYMINDHPFGTPLEQALRPVGRVLKKMWSS